MFMNPLTSDSFRDVFLDRDLIFRRCFCLTAVSFMAARFATARFPTARFIATPFVAGLSMG